MKTEEWHFADNCKQACLFEQLAQCKEVHRVGRECKREREVPGGCVENIQENICHCSNDNKQTFA